jgi:hypothetical protein
MLSLRFALRISEEAITIAKSIRLLAPGGVYGLYEVIDIGRLAHQLSNYTWPIYTAVKGLIIPRKEICENEVHRNSDHSK